MVFATHIFTKFTKNREIFVNIIRTEFYPNLTRNTKSRAKNLLSHHVNCDFTAPISSKLTTARLILRGHLLCRISDKSVEKHGKYGRNPLTGEVKSDDHRANFHEN
jgi:hypothetical protein